MGKKNLIVFKFFPCTFSVYIFSHIPATKNLFDFLEKNNNKLPKYCKLLPVFSPFFRPVIPTPHTLNL